MKKNVFLYFIFFPFLYFSQRGNGISAQGVSFYSAKKIQQHAQRYRSKLIKSGSRKASRRFIFKKGKTAAVKRRRR